MSNLGTFDWDDPVISRSGPVFGRSLVWASAGSECLSKRASDVAAQSASGPLPSSFTRPVPTRDPPTASRRAATTTGAGRRHTATGAV